jgi:hypothetical protein
MFVIGSSASNPDMSLIYLIICFGYKNWGKYVQYLALEIRG